jgi:ribosomal protein S9
MRGVNPARVRIVELQASEALARLGETDALEPIRAALFAPTEQSEFTALAAQQVARLNDEASRAILMRLVDGTGISARPTEVRIGCALALAQISPSDRPAVVKFARTLLRDRDAGSVPGGSGPRHGRRGGRGSGNRAHAARQGPGGAVVRGPGAASGNRTALTVRIGSVYY